MDTKTPTKEPSSHFRAWIITGIAVVVIAAAGWWFVEPKAKAIETSSTSILATAPPAATPRPLNADGAPRSD